ncbi:MAG TPA: lipopolysaccharide transport periplasmic protein LptA [Nevskiaceae bacterium]|nr:lipopolysaccharide transport periplasmic protein LptA [Nevskiaceae bacterium]
MRRARELSALVLGGWIACAAAADDKTQRAVDALRPTGPVTVTADHAQFEQGGAMLYVGHVQLVSDTLTLSGDKLELHQFPGNQFEAQITGAPAHLQHAGETNDKGETLPPITAQASTLHYDTRNGTVDINGQALMTRGKDEISGDNMHYNVPARRIEASGGNNGQVRMVLQPPPEKKPADKK